MSQEIELKLALPRSALTALRRHPLVTGSTRLGNAKTLDNTYYDTPDLQLKAAGIAVRTRKQGREWLQTVKCAARSTGGLTQRPEWEQAYTEAFDFSAVDEPRVRKRLMRLQDTLVPVFTTQFRRETRVFEQNEGTVRILMMVDTGEILAGERSEPICEVELELEQGSPLDLLKLACALAERLPLLPSDISKAERGYRLHLGHVQQAMRAEPCVLDPGMNPVQAFSELAGNCIRQWQANAVGASSHDDPEFIHQLRVSQRRLRSLIRLFAPALPDAFVQAWNEKLKTNAGSFGEARDLDVLYEEILAPVHGGNPDEEKALARLREAILQARDTARSQSAGQLDAAAQGRLILNLTTELLALPSNNLIGAADLGVFASLQLKRLRKKIRRRHTAARSLVPEQLHALRIALKQLRYGMEFFQSLMPASTVKPYLKALARAQNALGFINDVDVARGRLAACCGDDPVLNAAAGLACGWHGPRYRKLSKQAVSALEPLLWDKAPWRGLERLRRK